MNTTCARESMLLLGGESSRQRVESADEGAPTALPWALIPSSANLGGVAQLVRAAES